MWSKVGVDLTLDVKETGARNVTYRKGEYDVTGSAGGRGPISIFYLSPTLVGNGSSGGNGAQVDDPVIHEAIGKIRLAAATDLDEAMKQYRELMKYVLDQAYTISRPQYNSTIFWWPWLKNYPMNI